MTTLHGLCVLSLDIAPYTGHQMKFRHSCASKVHRTGRDCPMTSTMVAYVINQVNSSRFRSYLANHRCTIRAPGR